MLISNKNNDGVNRKRVRLMIGFVSLALIAAFFIISNQQSKHAPVRIFCDAEEVKGDAFYTDGHHFDGGDRQSDEQAHTGKYSCRVPTGKDLEFGISYKLEGVKPNEVYRLRVWRKKMDRAALAFLVAAGPKDSGYYRNTELAFKEHPNGWHLQELLVQIPKDFEGDQLNCYVYTNGKAVVFFDDFEITRLEGQNLAPEFQPRELALQVKDKAYRKLVQKRNKAYELGFCGRMKTVG